MTSRHAAVAGRVALLDLGDRIYPIGLVSGRCMWRPLPVHREAGALPIPPVVAVGGVLIAAADAHTLVAIPARNDARPLWRRRFPKHRLGRLAAAGGRLVVIDRRAQYLWVLDPTSGRVARRMTLVANPTANDVEDDPAAAQANAQVAVVGGVVCRSGLKNVVARDLSTGRVLWTREFRGRVKEVRRLDERHVGVNYRGERYAVVRVDRGEIIKEIRADGLDLPPLQATLDWPSSGNRLDRGRLLMFAKTDDEPPEFKVVSWPLDDSDPWEKGPFEFAHVSERMISASGDTLPVLLYRNRRGDDQAVGAYLTSPILLDKSRGAKVARRFAFDDAALTEQGALFGSGPAKIITDVVMSQGLIVAAASNGFCILRRETTRPSVSAEALRTGEAP